MVRILDFERNESIFSKREFSIFAPVDKGMRSNGVRPQPMRAVVPAWKKSFQRLALVLLLLAACASLALPLSQLANSHKGTLDFANFYTAGKIVNQGRSRNLYDLNMQRKIERKASIGGPFLPYYHPPFEALLFAAFSLFSYPHAFLLWAAMNLVVLSLVFYLLRLTGYNLKTEGYLVWLAVTLLLTIGVLLLGQDSLLLVPVFLLAFLALKKRRNYSAGLVLGVGLFRFEILLPFVFIFVLRRRWKVLAGFVTTGVFALVVSIAVVGWRGLLGYVETLLKVGTSAGQWGAMASVDTMPSLHGAILSLFGGVFPPFLVFPLTLLGTLMLLVWAAREFQSVTKPESLSFDLEFSLVMLAALLGSYYLFVHELTPLILAAFFILGFEGNRRRKGILENRWGTALLLLFVVVYGVCGGVFHFHNFSVLFVVLLGLMFWLSQELAALRGTPVSS